MSEQPSADELKQAATKALEGAIKALEALVAQLEAALKTGHSAPLANLFSEMSREQAVITESIRADIAATRKSIRAGARRAPKAFKH